MPYAFGQEQRNRLWTKMIILSILLLLLCVIYPTITPERVALNFMQAFKEVDVERCARYTDEGSIETVGLLLGTFSFGETIGTSGITPQWVDGSTFPLRDNAYASCVEDNVRNQTCIVCCDIRGLDYTVNLRQDNDGYWGVTLNIAKEGNSF